VTVARLIEKKGIRYLLEAMILLRDDHPGLRARIVGTGKDERALRGLAAELGLGEAAEELGRLPNAEVLPIVAASDVMVLPCVEAANGDLDSIPNALMEAQALGVPVVSTWVAGVPEIVRHGITGILVGQRDAAALARAIDLLLCKPRLRRAMGRAGAAWAREALDMRREVEPLVEAYRSRC
jgi:colanic acid/amylovoran biosynthesis glycosyltransferase